MTGFCARDCCMNQSSIFLVTCCMGWFLNLFPVNFQILITVHKHVCSNNNILDGNLLVFPHFFFEDVCLKIFCVVYFPTSVLNLFKMTQSFLSTIKPFTFLLVSTIKWELNASFHWSFHLSFTLSLFRSSRQIENTSDRIGGTSVNVVYKRLCLRLALSEKFHRSTFWSEVARFYKVRATLEEELTWGFLKLSAFHMFIRTFNFSTFWLINKSGALLFLKQTILF